MAPAPLLLAAPSAWAPASRRTARAVLLLLAVLVLAAVGLSDGAASGDGRLGFAFDTGLVEGVRHGGDYYGVAADLVRGGEATARPLVGVRLPTLAVVAATLPRPVVSALLATLALAVALAWYERLAPALSRWAGIGAAVLLLAGVAAAFRPESAFVPEVWAGLLVALSLARWRPGHAMEAIGWALAAALIDETAGLAMIVMALFAGRRRDRREMAGWGIALALLTLVIAIHRHAVETAGMVFADAAPASTAGIGGMLADLGAGTALVALPVALAAAFAVLALAGWSAWRDPLGLRVPTVSIAFLAVAALSPAGGSVTMLAAPFSLAGLVFLPDGLRALASAALDRRRIVVRRVLR